MPVWFSDWLKCRTENLNTTLMYVSHHLQCVQHSNHLGCHRQSYDDHCWPFVEYSTNVLWYLFHFFSSTSLNLNMENSIALHVPCSPGCNFCSWAVQGFPLHLTTIGKSSSLHRAPFWSLAYCLMYHSHLNFLLCRNKAFVFDAAPFGVEEGFALIIHSEANFQSSYTKLMFHSILLTSFFAKPICINYFLLVFIWCPYQLGLTLTLSIWLLLL